MVFKIKKSDLNISILEDINLSYAGYKYLSKDTRKLSALYNRERKKLFAIRDRVWESMRRDYNSQFRKRGQ